MKLHLLLWSLTRRLSPRKKCFPKYVQREVTTSILMILEDIEHLPCTSTQADHVQLSSAVQFSSVAQSCPTFCDPINLSTSGLPVHHQLLDFTQTHAHWVSDAIQTSHPLLSPSPPALNLSQHQSMGSQSQTRLKWLSSSSGGIVEDYVFTKQTHFAFPLGTHSPG